MNKKLLPPELIDLLTSNTGTTRKSNETFVRSFFELIEEVLQKESFVKIKGFGTFKLVSVNERESIKINTGERYQINSHTKISFTPDNTLKDLINKPFSHFETVILPESTTNEELEAIDAESIPTPDIESVITENINSKIVETSNSECLLPQTFVTIDESTSSEAELTSDFPSNENQLTYSTKNANLKKSPLTLTDNNTKEKTLDENQEDSANTNSKEDNIDNNIIATELDVPSTDVKKVVQQSIISSSNQLPSESDILTPEANIDEDMSTPNTYSHNLRNTLISLLLVVISYIAGYHHLIPLGYNPIKPYVELQHPTDSIISDSIQLDTLSTPAIPSAIDNLTKAQKLRQSLPDTLSVIRGLDKESVDLLWKDYAQVEVGSFYIIGTFKTHKLKPGETLYRLARQTYGHKDYAKYIILYNNFTDPNNIAVDSEILLPWLVEKAMNNKN